MIDVICAAATGTLFASTIVLLQTKPLPWMMAIWPAGTLIDAIVGTISSLTLPYPEISPPARRQRLRGTVTASVCILSSRAAH